MQKIRVQVTFEYFTIGTCMYYIQRLEQVKINIFQCFYDMKVIINSFSLNILFWLAFDTLHCFTLQEHINNYLYIVLNMLVYRLRTHTMCTQYSFSTVLQYVLENVANLSCVVFKMCSTIHPTAQRPRRSKHRNYIFLNTVSRNFVVLSFNHHHHHHQQLLFYIEIAYYIYSNECYVFNL